MARAPYTSNIIIIIIIIIVVVVVVVVNVYYSDIAQTQYAIS